MSASPVRRTGEGGRTRPRQRLRRPGLSAGPSAAACGWWETWWTPFLRDEGTRIPAAARPAQVTAPGTEMATEWVSCARMTGHAPTGGPVMDERIDSFGYWVRRRRKALDLTQGALAQKVSCSAAAIR